LFCSGFSKEKGQERGRRKGTISFSREEDEGLDMCGFLIVVFVFISRVFRLLLPRRKPQRKRKPQKNNFSFKN
jgi:hypothetical protein